MAVKIPVQTLSISIDPADLPPGPPGPAGGVILACDCDFSNADLSAGTPGIVVLLGREVLPTTGNSLIVEVALDARMTRSAAAVLADLQLQERVNMGAGWSAWTTLRTLRGFFGGGSVAVDVRGTRSAFYKRSLFGVARVQYQIVVGTLSSDPPAAITVYAGAALKYMETV